MKEETNNSETEKKETKKRAVKKTTKKVSKKTSPLKDTKTKNVTKEVSTKEATKKKETKKITKKVSKPRKKKIDSKVIEPVLIEEKPIVDKQEIETKPISYNNNNGYINVFTDNIKLKKFLTISLVVNVLLASLCLYFGIKSFNKPNAEQTVIKETVYIDNISEEDKQLFNLWNENKTKAFNKDDYKLQIVFESGIINEPVVQTNNNDTYFRKDYTTNKYKTEGTVFVDYLVDIEKDQNIVLYGHNIPKYLESKYEKRFSSLHLLEDKNNYESNKTIKLVYEDHIDYYLVAGVYKAKITQDISGTQYVAEGEPLYYFNNYSEEQFDEYLKLVNDRLLYKTNVNITNQDKLLTLQTCFDTGLDKLIVIAKKTGSLSIKH